MLYAPDSSKDKVAYLQSTYKNALKGNGYLGDFNTQTMPGMPYT